jgi:hypothetical protein
VECPSIKDVLEHPVKVSNFYNETKSGNLKADATTIAR